MKIIDRLFQYLDYKGVKPTRFEKNIGLSNGYLGQQHKRKADLGESIINKIIDNCLDLSVIWLITGKGEMIIHNSINDSGVSYSATCKRCEDKERIIEGLQKSIRLLEEIGEDQKIKIAKYEKSPEGKKEHSKQTG